jgi:hypothetical protein
MPRKGLCLLRFFSRFDAKLFDQGQGAVAANQLV